MGEKQLEQSIRASTPQIEFEHVDVAFGSTANQDLPIATILRPNNPEDIFYRVVDVKALSTPASFVIYRDTSTLRKAWQPGVIYLRCNVADVKVTLELFVKRPKNNV